MMGDEDIMNIQMLCGQGYGAKVITASYPEQSWSLSTLQMICHRVNETGSAVMHRAGSGRPHRNVLLQLVNILNTLFKY